MPDPTTPAKGLTQPTVGGDNNTWGALLNTNFAQIDAAFGGTLAKSISGSVTLSATDALNTGYRFTGTLTGAATITWPSFFGQAVIRNATSGGFSIVCGIAGATVTVLNGETVAVWSDGTDFVHQSVNSLITPVVDPSSLAAGTGSLAALTATNQFSTAFGYQTLNAMTTGLYNTAFGYQALPVLNDPSLVNGFANTAVGYQAMETTTTGQHNTAVGAHALRFNTTGSGNVGLGPNTLESAQTASNNTAVGFFAAFGVDLIPLTGDFNTAVGSNALQTIQGAAGGNTAVGTLALNTMTTASNNCAFGSNAMIGTSGNPLTGGNNVSVGAFSLVLIQGAATGNTAAGTLAAQNLSTGTNSVAVGYTAMQGSSGSPITGSSNTAVGAAALISIQGAAASNTAVGAASLNFMTTGSNNVAVGYLSLEGVSGTPLTGGANVGVGAFSLSAIQGAAANNTAHGCLSLTALTTGGSNTAIGVSTGGTLTTGSGNILIGANADVPTASTSNYINIGGEITGTIGTGLTFTHILTASSALNVAGLVTLTSQINGAAAQTATLTNAPAAGNPAIWVQVSVNGTTRYMPAW